MKSPVVDLKEPSVALALDKGIYSEQALGIAAHVFAGRAEVYLEETARRWRVTLKVKSAATAAPLAALAGEFVNELLNQEYRFLVGKLNGKLASLIVTQTLLSARGGQVAATLPAEEQTPEFKAEVERLMAQAAEEIGQTMPARLPDQGLPLSVSPQRDA